MWIRIMDIADRSKDPVKHLAMAMQELGIAYGLLMVHGQERGMKLYGERGLVKFDDEGEPCIWVDEKEMKRDKNVRRNRS